MAILTGDIPKIYIESRSPDNWCQQIRSKHPIFTETPTETTPQPEDETSTKLTLSTIAKTDQTEELVKRGIYYNYNIFATTQILNTNVHCKKISMFQLPRILKHISPDMRVVESGELTNLFDNKTFKKPAPTKAITLFQLPQSFYRITDVDEAENLHNKTKPFIQQPKGTAPTITEEQKKKQFVKYQLYFDDYHLEVTSTSMVSGVLWMAKDDGKLIPYFGTFSWKWFSNKATQYKLKTRTELTNHEWVSKTPSFIYRKLNAMVEYQKTKDTTPTTTPEVKDTIQKWNQLFTVTHPTNSPSTTEEEPFAIPHGLWFSDFKGAWGWEWLDIKKFENQEESLSDTQPNVLLYSDSKNQTTQPKKQTNNTDKIKDYGWVHQPIIWPLNKTETEVYTSIANLLSVATPKTYSHKWKIEESLTKQFSPYYDTTTSGIEEDENMKKFDSLKQNTSNPQTTQNDNSEPTKYPLNIQHLFFLNHYNLIHLPYYGDILLLDTKEEDTSFSSPQANTGTNNNVNGQYFNNLGKTKYIPKLFGVHARTETWHIDNTNRQLKGTYKIAFLSQKSTSNAQSDTQTQNKTLTGEQKANLFNTIYLGGENKPYKSKLISTELETTLEYSVQLLFDRIAIKADIPSTIVLNGHHFTEQIDESGQQKSEATFSYKKPEPTTQDWTVVEANKKLISAFSSIWSWTHELKTTKLQEKKDTTKLKIDITELYFPIFDNRSNSFNVPVAIKTFKTSGKPQPDLEYKLTKSDLDTFFKDKEFQYSFSFIYSTSVPDKGQLSDDFFKPQHELPKTLQIKWPYKTPFSDTPTGYVRKNPITGVTMYYLFFKKFWKDGVAIDNYHFLYDSKKTDFNWLPVVIGAATVPLAVMIVTTRWGKAEITKYTAFVTKDSTTI